MTKIKHFFSCHFFEIILFILIILYTTYFSWFTFLRHDHLYSARFDLGNMDQTVWNTTQGRLFTFTDPSSDKEVSRFSIHADFFLVFLAPFYFLFPSPKTLLFLQSFIIALGAIPIFLLTNTLIKNKLTSLMFSLSYLLYPPLQRANIYDFHSVTVVPTFILFAFYFAYIKKYLWFYFFAFLASSTKEEIPLLILPIGLYIFFKNKDRIIGVLTVILSLLWFITAVWVVIPFYRSGNSHFGVSFFTEFGESPNKIILGLIKQPIKVLTTIFSPNRLFYLFQLLLPVGFLSLLAPIIFLFSLPELLINLLSNVGVMQSIYYQYTSGITPFVFLSAIFGYHYLLNRFSKFKKLLFFYLIISFVAGSFLFGPLPFSKQADLNSIIFPHPDYKNVIEISKTIPSDYSVSITSNIAPHFTKRRNIYSFPINYNSADYSVILSGGIYEAIPSEEILRYIELLKSDKNYRLIFNDNKLFVFKKNE